MKFYVSRKNQIAAALGVVSTAALGMESMLWASARESRLVNRRTGLMDKSVTPRLIAEWCDWPVDDADRLVSVFVDVGIIGRLTDGTMRYLEYRFLSVDSLCFTFPK